MKLVKKYYLLNEDHDIEQLIKDPNIQPLDIYLITDMGVYY